MRGFIKVSLLFGIIVICVFSIIIASTSISQFYSNRQVAMGVSDSEDALISLPESINIHIDALKLTTNYFTMLPTMLIANIDSEESEGLGLGLESDHSADDSGNLEAELENSEVQADHLEQTKELVNTEESITINAIHHNLVIKNNMNQTLFLERIDFDDSLLQSTTNGLLLETGSTEQIELALGINLTPSELETLSNASSESKATLFFSWDNGRSTIYKDVFINVTITEETVEQNIEQ